MIVRVVLPTHLRTLARVTSSVELEVSEPVTQKSVLDSLEAAYPMLRGTVRDPATKMRRPFIRFYVFDQDFSDEPLDSPLPAEVAAGKELFRIVGAMAGG
jgi:hypothetical protein